MKTSENPYTRQNCKIMIMKTLFPTRQVYARLCGKIGSFDR
jgi:hypothetical protein